MRCLALRAGGALPYRARAAFARLSPLLGAGLAFSVASIDGVVVNSIAPLDKSQDDDLNSKGFEFISLPPACRPSTINVLSHRPELPTKESTPLPFASHRFVSLFC